MTYKTLGQQRGWIVTSTSMSDLQDQDALVSFVSYLYVPILNCEMRLTPLDLGSQAADYVHFATIGALVDSAALQTPNNSNVDSRSPTRIRFYFDI